MSGQSDYRTIDLDHAVAGMTLAEALLDAHGGVLLPEGTALTEATLASLRRRGVPRCVVAAIADAPDPTLQARERERRVSRLHYLFRHSGASEGGARLLTRLIVYRERDQS